MITRRVLFLIQGFKNDPNTNVLKKKHSDQRFHHIETSKLICSADPLISFSMVKALFVGRLTYFWPMLLFYTP